MPSVGLDISDTAITFIELLLRPEGFEVGRFGRRLIPEGVIISGYVNDGDAVARALSEMREEFKLDFIRASISEEKAYLFKTQIPRMEKGEIRGALEFRLEENVPIPAKEAVFDYSVISSAEHKGSEHLDVGVTVLPLKVVETYVDLFRKAGLVPLSFEICAHAIMRAVVARGDRRTLLLVNFGETRTALSIVSDEVVHFPPTIPVGSRNITEAIAAHFSVGSEEARVIKEDRAFLKDKEHTNVFSGLTGVMAVLREEMQKLSIYWSTHRDSQGESGKALEEILLCGRDAGMTGLSEYLSYSLNVPCKVADVWQNICRFEAYIPPIPRIDSLDYAAAIGLALPKGY